MLDNKCNYVCGCNKLTKKEWEKGWYEDKSNGILFQHNCPTRKEMK